MADLRTDCTGRISVNTCSSSSGARGNVSLNAAYSHLVSGPAFAIRYPSPTTSPVQDVYFFIDAFTGTAANVTMTGAIYAENTSNANRPTSTSLATTSSVTVPTANDKWAKATFGSYSQKKGETLWITLSNTAGAPATDYPQILTHGAYGMSLNAGRQRQAACITTSSGFTTDGTTATTPIFVVVHADGTVYGNPFTTIVAGYASSTLKRGIVIPSLTAALDIAGLGGLDSLTAASGIQIYTGTQLPNDTPAYSFALGTDTGEQIDERLLFKVFDQTLRLAAGTKYRAVLTFGSASTSPSCLQIEDYATYSSVFDAYYDGLAACYSCIDSASNTWTDDKSLSPCLALWPQAQVAQSSGVLAATSITRGPFGSLELKRTDYASGYVTLDIPWSTEAVLSVGQASALLPADGIAIDAIEFVHKDSDIISGTYDFRILLDASGADLLRGAATGLSPNASSLLEMRDVVSDAEFLPIVVAGPRVWYAVVFSGAAVTNGLIRIHGRKV